MKKPPTWIFDLDDTLHDAKPHIFPHLHSEMAKYIRRELNLSEEEAHAMRHKFWKAYGATLKGLIKHHGTDPHHFLHATHQFNSLEKMLVFDPALRHILKRLPGKKIIFSNAPAHYIRQILNLMGVAHLFDDIYAIEHTRFRPKPDKAGYLRLLHEHRLDPHQCIMVEDSLANLKTAKRLGMRTVWISRSKKRRLPVDYAMASANQLRKFCAH
ncbi:MAG: pyrimidine 5'-nucleotidase [Burkholderiales bacterium]